MHIKTILSLAVLLAGISGPVIAVQQGDTYLGAGQSKVIIDPNASGVEEMGPTSAVVRFGYSMADSVAVEGRIGSGVGNDTVGDSGDKIDVDIKRIVSGYLAGYFPVSDRFSLYWLAGISSVSIELNKPGGGYSRSDDIGLSYGIGAEANITKSISGYFEYIEYPDGDYKTEDLDIKAATIGAKYSF